MDQFELETKRFVEDLKNGVNNILVAVRVRPLNQKERVISENETIRILDGKVIVLLDPSQENQDDVLRKNRNKETQFAFDYVFDQFASQQKVYDNSTAFMMDGVLEGYNTTVFAYGATGSGKTFTQFRKLPRMIGSQNQDGLMPRAMQTLFNKAQSEQFKETTIKVSYVEIYNENLRDLLTQEDKNLEIREDKNNGIQIPGVQEIEVKSVSEVLALLKVGNRNRSKESTDANKESSRSHAILQLNLETKEKNQGIQEQIILSKLSLVDLAGSERASNTNNKGLRMVEGAKINQSLLVLGNCIQSLSEANEKGIKNPFIPYRNSKLTRLLKDSLGGNCRTVMVSNVSPSVHAFEETYNTLVYANRAKNIKTAANRNVLQAEKHISNYAQLIQNLRQENEELKQLIQQQNISPNPHKLPFLQQQSNSKPVIKDLEAQITQNIQDQIDARIRLYDIEEQSNHYQQNILFLQSQKQRTQDKFEQMRLQERIDNSKSQKMLMQRSQEEVESETQQYEMTKVELLKVIQQYPEGSYKAYLTSLIKQGELKLETLELKQAEKRTKYQEILQEEQVRQLRNHMNQQKVSTAKSKQNNNNNSMHKKSLTKVLKPSIPSLPGVDSPYPAGYAYNSYKYQQKKSNSKLPPATTLLQQQNRSPKQITNITSAYQKPTYQKYRMGQRFATRGYRPPSYRPPSEQRSALGRYINKSLDLGHQSSSDLKAQISMKKLQQMHKQYQQQRFTRAISTKKNQTSLPTLNNKILLPGMVHESPYVKNFQKDIDSLEVKKERLKRLNINIKGDYGQKFQIQ